MTRPRPAGPGIPWRKSLLVRLLLTSVAIAVLSVGATAWLAVQITTRAVQEERGQVLSDDSAILRKLSGFAATHADWTGVQSTVRTLSRTMDRRITLTTAAGRPIADSAAPDTALPARASAVVDPLSTDTYTEPGAQLVGIDPRVVGPYLLPAAERKQVEKLAGIRLACIRKYGGDGTISQDFTGRAVLTPDGGEDSVPAECADGKLNTPTATEQMATNAFVALARSCLDREPKQKDPQRRANLTDTRGPAHAKLWAGDDEQNQRCLHSAAREQLDPYVAPRANLYLGNLSRRPAGLDLSPANQTKIVGVTGLVLAVTVAVTAVVAVRLVRPLRALTAAARQPPQRHARVAVTTKDETGCLAAAFNDLTARREQPESQRKALISDIAHELRTPLTNIRGWLEVTRDGLLEPDPGLIASLHDEALLLQHIIDDLQDLAAADAGTLRLRREPVGVEELLAQVVAAHSTLAEASGIRLRTSTDPGLWLEADPARMRQALGNLVANALRHTPTDGTVGVIARRDGDDAVLTVEDTGDGLAPEDLPHVFERFWRAEKSRSRRTGGSGLGLSIVRKFVEAHGGTVTAGGGPGGGAVFTVRLPRAADPEEVEPQPHR
ncbi:sensor histidine kinase [Streptomyces sp. NPDC057428]|uniref:sensor histidine kinase n=1 Tax=Streptomyces sp. NPDC057428 TaxID=3346129 RepID=UPI003693EDA4